MKKYRLEIFVGSVFAALLTSMLWKLLAIPSIPYLPWIILGLCLVPPLAVVASSFSRTGEESERYAPAEFAKLFVSSVVGIVICVAFAVLLNRDNLSKTFDLTKTKVHSLSDETVLKLKSLDKELEIVCIPELKRVSRYCEDSLHLMNLYAQTNPSKVRFVALRMNDIANIKRVAPSGDQRLVLMMEGNRSELSGPITESKLTNAIIGLNAGKKTVYFLTGHGEPSLGWDGERNYAVLVEFLKKRGYEAKEHKISTGDLPADAKVLVAGSNTQTYPPFVETMLRRFLAKGGQLVLSVNPYRELGLSKLLADVGVTLEQSVLIGDGGKSQMGAQLAQANAMRPPVLLGEFSKLSDMTSKLSIAYGVSDGARPIAFAEKKTDGISTKGTELLSAFAAIDVPVSDVERNKISLEGPFQSAKEGKFEPNKTYKVGYDIEIENPNKLDPTVASAAPAPVASPAPGAAPATPSKDKAHLVVLGFELQSKYTAPENAPQTEIPLLALAVLHKDKEFVSIPTKDFSPKNFKLDRNPASWLSLFAFVLPVGTILMGLYIWMRRRSS